MFYYQQDSLLKNHTTINQIFKCVFSKQDQLTQGIFWKEVLQARIQKI